MATTPPLVQQRKLPQSLYYHQDRYFLVLDTYYKLTNRHELQKKQMEKDFDLNVMDVLLERNGDKLQEQPLRVIGVGSSEGNTKNNQ